MFKILCLTTGSEVRWPKSYIYPTQKMVPREVQEDIAHFYDTAVQSGIIYFNTEEQAGWFVRRRLSYNPKRTDSDKLDFMNSVFEASGMDPGMYTKKHMFEIIQC
jgi:hypothetical protein